jgi:putative membrane protein
MQDEEKRNQRNQSWGGWAIVIIIGVIGLALLFGDGGMMGWGMMDPDMIDPDMIDHYDYHVSPWWGLTMMLFRVVLLGGVALLVVWLLRQSRLIETGFHRGPRPLEILQERYAKGELTKEQYEQMRADLTEHQ